MPVFHQPFLQDRMELLFRGCAASRVKIGGLAMQPQYGEGATRSAAVLLDVDVIPVVDGGRNPIPNHRLDGF